MKSTPCRVIVLGVVAFVVSGCQSSRLERKAEYYRSAGVARDMGEARRLADNFYWPEGAARDDAERRQRSEVFPLPRDAR